MNPIRVKGYRVTFTIRWKQIEENTGRKTNTGTGKSIVPGNTKNTAETN